MKWGFATTNEIKDLRPSFIAGLASSEREVLFLKLHRVDHYCEIILFLKEGYTNGNYCGRFHNASRSGSGLEHGQGDTAWLNSPVRSKSRSGSKRRLSTRCTRR